MSRFSFVGCFTDELQNASDKYLRVAVAAGDPQAIRELYASRSWNTELKAEFRAGVLKKAETSKNPDILVSAAEIYRDDTINVIDTEKEKDYRYAAWRAGDKASAGRLAEIYVSQGDMYKAYMWSLRCFQECRRSNDIDLGKLSEKIPPEEITKLQARARESE